MKLLVSLFFISTLSQASQEQPTMEELQKIVGQFKEAYGIVEDNKSYNPNKKVSDKELKEQVDKMQQILKENPNMQYYYGK